MTYSLNKHISLDKPGKVFLGVLATIAVYVLLPVFLNPGRDLDFFEMLTPLDTLLTDLLSLFTGGLLTGYLLGKSINGKFSECMLYAPGLYLFVPAVFVVSYIPFGMIVFMTVYLLFWILISALGVKLGLILRKRRLRE